MAKLIQLEKEKYNDYVKNHKEKSHFLQSLAWGELSKAKKNLSPYYLGLVDNDNNILGATLLLQKHLPLNYSYFYAPRGFVIDYNDKNLIKEMTKEVVSFVKKKKGIFVKMDPDLIYKKFNYTDEEIELKNDITKIFENIKACGWKHLGFTKNFETTQPRYTFRVDLTQNMEELENHFSKTTKQRIAKAKKLGTEVYIGDESDIDEFYHLMTLTETRKDFVSYTKDYYVTLYKIMKEENMVTLFMGKVTFDKVIENLEKELKNINNQISILPIDNLSKSAKNKLNELTKQKENILNEIKKYKEKKKMLGDSIILNAHMIINYGNKAWVLYAGNHNELMETYSNYHTYSEHLKYCKEQGIEIYDQFGTIGDLRRDNPRMGLHEFKKKFGGDYIEFLGEFDYVTNKFMYFVFTKLVPFYRNMIKKRAKKEVENEVNRTK